LLLGSAVTIIALTLGFKIDHYTRSEQPNGEGWVIRQQKIEAEVEAFLGRFGWSPAGVLNLTLDGYYRAARFTSSACAGELRVVVMGGHADDLGLLRGLAQDEQVYFVSNRGVADELSSPQRTKQSLVHLFGSLGLPLLQTFPLLGIAAPRECHVETSIPWHLLWTTHDSSAR
jgi:hypothetical protein